MATWSPSRRERGRGCGGSCGRPSRSGGRCATSPRPPRSIREAESRGWGPRRLCRRGGGLPRGIDHVLGRRDFESPPRPWEVTMLARRLAGAPAPPLAAYLDWGFTAIDLEVRATADRDAAAARIPGLRRRARRAQADRRDVRRARSRAHHERDVRRPGRCPTAGPSTPPTARPTSCWPNTSARWCGSRPTAPGSRCRSVTPFGRLERRHVFDGLARGLAGGELDPSHGGAGLA